MVTQPHSVPSSAETVAATASQKSAAPGLRITRPPRTAGTSHTPYMMAWPAGRTRTPGRTARHSRPQAQKMTPKATAIIDGDDDVDGAPAGGVVVCMMCSQF